MWPPDSSRTPPQLRRCLVGLTPKLLLLKRDKLAAWWEWYHWICWHTSTYSDSCFLKSRVLGAHHHFPSLSSSQSSWGAQSMSSGALPDEDAPKRVKKPAKHRVEHLCWTPSGKTQLRTLYPWDSDQHKDKEHHDHYDKLEYMDQQSLNSLIALLWFGCLGFFNCSIMTYISNTVARAAAQHLQVFNFHRSNPLVTVSRPDSIVFSTL